MQIDGKFVVKGKINDVWVLVLEPGTLLPVSRARKKSSPPIIRLIIVWSNNRSVPSP